VCCPGLSATQREELHFWRFGAFPDGELDLHHPLPQGVHTLHSDCAGTQMASDSRCPICRVELSESPPWEFRLNGAIRLAPTMQRPAPPPRVQAQPAAGARIRSRPPGMVVDPAQDAALQEWLSTLDPRWMMYGDYRDLLDAS
jgi:hypothetical protein